LNGVFALVLFAKKKMTRKLETGKQERKINEENHFSFRPLSVRRFFDLKAPPFDFWPIHKTITKQQQQKNHTTTLSSSISFNSPPNYTKLSTEQS
jgi:hypothetical protein